jgi:hypothetical protein
MSADGCMNCGKTSDGEDKCRRCTALWLNIVHGVAGELAEQREQQTKESEP